MDKIYFKGLDSLRGFAAVIVVLGHVELIKQILHLNNLADGGGPFFLYAGGQAVTFFFVLSGFLITYLLIIEKEKNKDISIKNFYIKRVLRIWPVYYLLFACGFLLLPLIPSKIFLVQPIPDENYLNGFFFNLILLPNFGKVSNPVAFQSWSIGVEEQFYIFWPLILSRINSLKKLFTLMICIVIGIYLIRASVYLNVLSITNWPFLDDLNKFFAESRFDNMAVGGALAIIVYKKGDFKVNWVFSTFVYILVAIILAKSWSIGFGIDNVISALGFAGLIYVIISLKSHYFLESGLFKYIGKISYGLYMYHVIGILFSLKIVLFINPFFKGDFNGSGFYYNIILYALSLFITFIISILSYHFMEIKILKLRSRFLRNS